MTVDKNANKYTKNKPKIYQKRNFYGSRKFYQNFLKI